MNQQVLYRLNPLAKTLTQNFCQFISEPLLKAPNSKLRAYEEVVQSTFKVSPLYNTQIGKGNARTRVFNIKRDLFAWLILFQPELKQVEEVPKPIRGQIFFKQGENDGDPSTPFNLEHQISNDNLILLPKG